MINKRSAIDFFRRTAIFWVLILLCAVMAIINPIFIKPSNIMLIVKQSSITGMLSIGMMMVILTGGIDLSVGSIIAFSSVCSAMLGGLAEQNVSVIVPVLVALAGDLLWGAANGVMVSYVRFPAFIMTLATTMIARGVAKVMCNGKPVFGISDDFLELANGFVGPIPNLVLYFLAVFIIGYFILNRSVLGLRIYAVGGNEKAARLSGVDTRRVKLFVYVFCGLVAGLCGALMTSRISSGSSIAAEGYELNAIAAVVIGGTSMSGGAGSIWGTVVGALIITSIQNGLDMMGVSDFFKNIIQGLIIIAAVLFDLRSKAKQQD